MPSATTNKKGSTMRRLLQRIDFSFDITQFGRVFSLLAFLLFWGISSQAARYYLNNGTDPSVKGNWWTVSGGTGSNPGSFANDGDIFEIESGKSGTLGAAWTLGSGASAASLSLIVNGTLTINSGFALTLKQKNSGSCAMTVNGTLIFLGTTAATNQIVGDYSGTGSSKGSVTLGLASGATLKTANLGGIVSGTNGSINNTNLTETLNIGANYEFTGSSAQVTLGLPATVNNLTINNSGGVTLSAASTSVSGILTLTSGKLTTTSSNLLAVTNTTASAVTGYSASSYVNGPLQWSLANGNSYFFPVGDGSYYRPFEMNSITCSSPVVRVTMASSGASTYDGTLTAVAARNWYAQLISGSFTSATIRITEGSLGASNVVASSSAIGGSYTTKGGNSPGSTITSNAGIAYTASTYYAIGTISAAPSITLSDNGTQVALANVAVGTSNLVLHKSALAVTTSSASLTGMTCTTSGN